MHPNTAFLETLANFIGGEVAIRFNVDGEYYGDEESCGDGDNWLGTYGDGCHGDGEGGGKGYGSDDVYGDGEGTGDGEGGGRGHGFGYPLK